MMKIIFYLFLFFPLSSFSGLGEFKLLLKGIKARSSDHVRDIYVYLPPDFSFSHKIKYPVLYMHDGQNLFDPKRSSFGNTWKVEESLNYLISNKLIPPMIVVGIDNTPDRTWEYTHAWDMSRSKGGGAKEYLDFIVFDLKRYIDHIYPTNPSKNFTGIMGSSLGGLVSLYAGAVYSDVFGLVGALSPSVWWNNKSILQVLKDSDLPSRLYIDSGSLGGERPKEAQEVFEVYRERNLKKVLFFVDEEGEHNEISWAQRFPKALIFLFGQN
jgi:predicted alpha/beta superfamily hydrolase